MRFATTRSACFCGPAGTGKTLLGIESARRAAALGRNILVLCFNHNLGNWLAAAVDRFGPGRIVVGNVHALLRERIMTSSLASDLAQAEAAGMDGEELFGRLYYELGALAIEESGERFDDIVFDEVQDLPARAVSDLRQSVDARPRHVRVLLLGDSAKPYTSSIRSTCVHAQGSVDLVLDLRLNCRNTRRIALQMGILSSSASKGSATSSPTEIKSASSIMPGRSTGFALERMVGLAAESGQKASEVVILGPQRCKTSLLCNKTSIGGWSIRDLTDARPGDLAYSTIHAFKGLERPVVIIIDSTLKPPRQTSWTLLYVAMSRARLRCSSLAPRAARGAIEQRLALGVLAAAGVRQS